MKRLSTVTVLSLLLSATALTGARAQDVAAICKIASSGAGTVVSLPVSPQLAQELQAGGVQAQPGGIAQVHGDGKVEYGGQDISQQTQTICANGGAQPQGDVGADNGAKQNTAAKTTHKTRKRHNSTASAGTTAGDHYTPTASGEGAVTTTAGENAATAGGSTSTGTSAATTSGAGPETLPGTPDAGQTPTGAAPGTSSGTLGAMSATPDSSSSGLPAPTSSTSSGGGSAAFSPPPSSTGSGPSSALTAPAPGGAAASPSLSAPAAPMHSGIESPTGPTSSSGSMGGSSSMGGGSMGGGSSGGSSGGGSSGGGSH